MAGLQNICFGVMSNSTVLTSLTGKSCRHNWAWWGHSWQLGAQWAKISRAGYSSLQYTRRSSVPRTGWGSIPRTGWGSVPWTGWGPVPWTGWGSVSRAWRKPRTRVSSFPWAWWQVVMWTWRCSVSKAHLATVPWAWRRPFLKTWWSSLMRTWRFLISFKSRVDALVQWLKWGTSSLRWWTVWPLTICSTENRQRILNCCQTLYAIKSLRPRLFKTDIC